MATKQKTLRSGPGGQNNTGQGSARQSQTTLQALHEFLEGIAPPQYAEPWDRVGMVSAPRERNIAVSRVMICLDLTPSIRDVVLADKVQLLICYHPPLFKPVENLCVSGQSPAAIAVELSQRGVWIYSPHTALDVAAGGTNDCLAAALGLRPESSLLLRSATAESVKLVVFVPESHLEQVATAVFEAGAGRIGMNSRYTQCSFRTAGTGTFFGDESTSPAVGSRGQLEFVPEIRFETVVPKSQISEVVTALRRNHPYEEPAFDLFSTQGVFQEPGLGRIARLTLPKTLKATARLCRYRLKLKHVAVTGGPESLVESVVLLAGSAGTTAAGAMKDRGISCLITGEMKHHDMLQYSAMGLNVICLGHAVSEQPVLQSLQRRLEEAFSGLQITIGSQGFNNTGPFVWM